MISLLFGLIQGLSYYFLGKKSKAIASWIGAVGGFIAGKSGSVAIKAIVRKYSKTMVYGAKHWVGKIRKFSPSRLRKRVEWIFSLVNGIVGLADNLGSA